MLTKVNLQQRNGVGDFFPFFGTSLPTGYLYCDGSSLSTTTYANLFAQIGYTYGGAGASFNLPDTRGRTLAQVGVADGYDFGDVGDTTGAQTVTLNSGTYPVPAHTHNQSMAHRHGDGAGNFVNYHSHSLGTGIASRNDTPLKQGAAIFKGALASSASDGNVGTSSYSTGGAVANAVTGVSIDGVSGHSQAIGSAEAHPNMMAWVAIPFIIRYA